MKNSAILIFLLFGISFFCYSQETYKINNTEYYYNKTYATTGHPMVKRSQSNKSTFLRNNGYTSTPYGYEIDHIVPLSKGGTDSPSNMQLLSKSQHARKTAIERANNITSIYSNNYTTSSYSIPNSTYRSTNTTSSYSVPNSTYSSSYPTSSYSIPKSSYATPAYSPPSYSPTHTIQTGSRGGQYYINSNGNKSYVRRN